MDPHADLAGASGDARCSADNADATAATATATATAAAAAAADADADADAVNARARRWSGVGLLLIGILALVRGHVAALPEPDLWTLGEPIALDIEALQGEDFRLLPGVGPVLAARLEAARVAAGGRLSPSDLHKVSGVGPSLRGRWQALRTH